VTHYSDLDTSSVEAQLVSLYGDREQLERELGVSESMAIIDMVRSLESQLRDLYHEREQGGVTASAAGASPAASLELQLIDLYEQRERLQQRIGCADASEVIDMVGSLEHQLQDLYREREHAHGEAARVAAQIQDIARELQGSYRGAEVTYAAEPSSSRWQVTWRSS
jgi:hypothetical protein